MKFSDIPKNPDQKTLRQFAGLCVLFFGGLGGYKWYQESEQLAMVLGGVAAVIGILGVVAPSVLRVVFVTWMIVVFPIGWVVSHTILLLMFCCVFTPLGLIMRMCGHDPLRLRKPLGDSYWIEKKQHHDPSRYLKQF